MRCNIVFLFLSLLQATAVFSAERTPTFSRSSYFRTLENKELKGYVVKQFDSPSLLSCGQQCMRNEWCTSTNYKMSSKKDGKGTCELNKHDISLVNENINFHDQQGVTFSMLLLGCLITSCLNGGSCLPDMEKQTFSCSCKQPWTGKTCEIKIDLAGLNSSTCKEAYEKNLSKQNGAYSLKVGSETIVVFCHMTSLGACGGSGWTLVMKMNGAQRTFHYDSNLWTNKKTFNLEGGKTGFDTRETKLPTYWNTPFTRICLGMKIGQQEKFIAINMTANSLYSLIADGQYRATSLGRDTWKTLIGSQAFLYRSCNSEGFNVKTDDSGFLHKARIGILGTDRYGSCFTSDSRIGLGTGGFPYDSNTCGNEVEFSHNVDERHIKAMGYILVK
ncbi:hypothetical protein ACROYT_G029775 [Oculina patagonica]